MAAENEILVELNKQDLEIRLNILKNHLPKYIRPYNYILNYLLHYDKINKHRSNMYPGRWNMRFYKNRNGNKENCTFVTITGTQDYCITVFTLEKSGNELKECLEQTSLIQWHVKPLSVGVDQFHFNLVSDVLKSKRNDWEILPSEYVMYIPKERVKKLSNTILDEGIYIKPLDVKHVKLINDNWLYKYENSASLIKQSIEFNGGVALFNKTEPSPIAWIGTNDFLTPGFLHTIENERRKGYGTHIFTYELKRIARKYNIDLFTYVVSSNKPSIEMHRQMGFQIVNNLIWITH